MGGRRGWRAVQWREDGDAPGGTEGESGGWGSGGRLRGSHTHDNYQSTVVYTIALDDSRQADCAAGMS